MSFHVRLRSTLTLAPSTTLGGYEIVALIGAGGMDI
jgi:hypothetical protein